MPPEYAPLILAAAFIAALPVSFAGWALAMWIQTELAK